MGIQAAAYDKEAMDMMTSDQEYEALRIIKLLIREHITFHYQNGGAPPLR